jgi:hypothetical protein
VATLNHSSGGGPRWVTRHAAISVPATTTTRTMAAIRNAAVPRSQATSPVRYCSRNPSGVRVSVRMSWATMTLS